MYGYDESFQLGFSGTRFFRNIEKDGLSILSFEDKNYNYRELELEWEIY